MAMAHLPWAGPAPGRAVRGLSPRVRLRFGAIRMYCAVILAGSARCPQSGFDMLLPPLSPDDIKKLEEGMKKAALGIQ